MLSLVCKLPIIQMYLSYVLIATADTLQRGNLIEHVAYISLSLRLSGIRRNGIPAEVQRRKYDVT